MSDYKLVASTTLFDSPRVRILTDTVEHHGRRRDGLCLEGPTEAIACLAFTGAGQDSSLQRGPLFATQTGLISS